MEYQNIINLFENTPSQPSKFRSKNWVEINDELCGTYNTNSQIKFKTTVLKSRLCNYSDAYIFVKDFISCKRRCIAFAGAGANNNNKQVAFRNCIPLLIASAK